MAVCYVDPASFDAPGGSTAPGATAPVVANYLAQHDVPLYLVRRDADINLALSQPLAVGAARAARPVQPTARVCPNPA